MKLSFFKRLKLAFKSFLVIMKNGSVAYNIMFDKNAVMVKSPVVVHNTKYIYYVNSYIANNDSSKEGHLKN